MKVNIVSVAVKHWIGVMKMAELIEMPYGNEKALAGEFVKKYSEVQLDVEMKRKQCFVNSHCSSDCPNAEYEMADDRYGFGIADDMGLEKISCKQCRYNTGRCEDCLFIHSKDCPEYKESEDEKKMLDKVLNEED